MGFFVVFCLLPRAAPAEEGDAKNLEVTAALGVYVPFLDTTYVSQFSPPFTGQTISSSATQTLSLQANRNAGLSLGFAYLPVERVGIQVLFDRFETSLEGESSSYDVRLDYISRPPPDYAPREQSYTSSQEMSDPEGDISSLTFSGNILVATGGEKVRGALSGGVSVFRTKTSFRALGFTTLWEGGHSVLFLENYKLAVEAGPSTQVGFNIGGELAIAFGPAVWLAIDGRYFYSPSVTVDIRLTDIVNLDEIIIREPIEDLQEQMNPPPIEVDPSFFRVSVGLKVRL